MKSPFSKYVSLEKGDSGVEMTWEGREMQTFRRFYTSYDVETELVYYNQLAFTYNADGIKHTYVCPNRMFTVMPQTISG